MSATLTNEYRDARTTTVRLNHETRIRSEMKSDERENCRPPIFFLVLIFLSSHEDTIIIVVLHFLFFVCLTRKENYVRWK